MLRYILKRILIFIPTLFIISLVIYMLSVFAPGDPVANMLNKAQGGEGNQSEKASSDEAYRKMREKLNLHLPTFYFNLATSADSDTLHKIEQQFHRENLARLTNQYGNWDRISNYYHTLLNFEESVYNLEPDSASVVPKRVIRNSINNIHINYEEDKLRNYFDKIEKELTIFDTSILKRVENESHLVKKVKDAVFGKKYGDWVVSDYFAKLVEVIDEIHAKGVGQVETDSLPVVIPYRRDTMNIMELREGFKGLKTAYAEMKGDPTRGKLYVPAIHWHGTNNRYHKWITQFVKGEFGISYQDQLEISDKIGERIFWTMLLSIISIFLTYLMAVPLGVFSAVNKGKPMDNISSTLLFVLYSLPNFWIATLLINYFCNPDYLQWFPPFGVGEVNEAASFWDMWVYFRSFDIIGFFSEIQLMISNAFTRMPFLILPLICWTYGSLAFLSRQMRGGMLGVLRQDYIRTARAKGLGENTVIWKHAFRNSLLPIITLFANVFPLMISGSVVIEVIFTLPGMGKMLVDAMVAQDFPVVFTVVMMVAVLTMLGYLIADVLYAFVDPRITYSSKK